MIELYEKPESTECMREMNAIGDQGWQDYTSDQVHNMTSHLMTYPIKVCSIQSGGMLFALFYMALSPLLVSPNLPLKWTLLSLLLYSNKGTCSLPYHYFL